MLTTEEKRQILVAFINKWSITPFRLSKILGVDQSTVSRYINRERNIPKSLIFTLWLLENYRKAEGDFPEETNWFKRVDSLR